MSMFCVYESLSEYKMLVSVHGLQPLCVYSSKRVKLPFYQFHCSKRSTLKAVNKLQSNYGLRRLKSNP